MSRCPVSWRLLEALGGHPGEACWLWEPGEPIPKARPRLGGRGRRRAHTPPRAAQAEKGLAWAILASLGGRSFEGPVAVALHFRRATRRRVDSDNLAKLVLDAATKAGAWADDSQVLGLAVRLELGHPEPGTILGVSALG